MTKYFITERSLGNAFTTFRSPAGEECRVPIGATKIGPFPSIPACADWLAKKALPRCSYLIEELRAASITGDDK